MAKNSQQRRLGAIEGEVVTGRTLAQCESAIESAQKVVRQATVEMQKFSEALAEIREKRLYKATHSSWDAYCSQRWGFTGRTANRQIEQVVAAVELATGEWPSQRELARLREEKVGRASDSENNSDTGDTPPPDPVPEDDPPDEDEPSSETQDQGEAPNGSPAGTEPTQEPPPAGLPESAHPEDVTPEPPPETPPTAADDDADQPPSGVSVVVLRKALDLIASSSVEELKEAGHAKLRDAVDRAASADGRKLVMLDDWLDWHALLAEKASAPVESAPTPEGPPGREQVELAVRALIDVCRGANANAFTRAGWGSVLTLTRKHLGPIIEKKAAESTKKESA